MVPEMTLPVYGTFIYIFCLQLQTGLCGVEYDSQNPITTSEDPQATEETEVEEESGTIKWPFSEDNFQHPIQSPIDVITSFIKENKELEPLKIYEPKIKGVNAVVCNSGTTATVHIDEKSVNDLPYLMGGPIKKDEKFLFKQMHFHWGRGDEIGSEHMIDAEAFAMEIHMVHFNSKYGSYAKALKKNDGLAVLTIFAEIGEKDNKLLKPLQNVLPLLKTAKVEKILPWNDAMKWAISGMKINREYYTYPGSLTTYPFKENVAFILLPKPISISSDQLRAFRDLNHDDKEDSVTAATKKRKTGPITHNNRKLQPSYHRPIFKGNINVERKRVEH